MSFWDFIQEEYLNTTPAYDNNESVGEETMIAESPPHIHDAIPAPTVNPALPENQDFVEEPAPEDDPGSLVDFARFLLSGETVADPVEHEMPDSQDHEPEVLQTAKSTGEAAQAPSEPLEHEPAKEQPSAPIIQPPALPQPLTPRIEVTRSPATSEVSDDKPVFANFAGLMKNLIQGRGAEKTTPKPTHRSPTPLPSPPKSPSPRVASPPPGPMQAPVDKNDWTSGNFLNYLVNGSSESERDAAPSLPALPPSPPAQPASPPLPAPQIAGLPEPQVSNTAIAPVVQPSPPVQPSPLLPAFVQPTPPVPVFVQPSPPVPVFVQPSLPLLQPSLPEEADSEVFAEDEEEMDEVPEERRTLGAFFRYIVEGSEAENTETAPSPSNQPSPVIAEALPAAVESPVGIGNFLINLVSGSDGGDAPVVNAVPPTQPEVQVPPDVQPVPVKPVREKPPKPKALRPLPWHLRLHAEPRRWTQAKPPPKIEPRTFMLSSERPSIVMYQPPKVVSRGNGSHVEGSLGVHVVAHQRRDVFPALRSSIRLS